MSSFDLNLLFFSFHFLLMLNFLKLMHLFDQVFLKILSKYHLLRGSTSSQVFEDEKYEFRSLWVSFFFAKSEFFFQIESLAIFHIQPTTGWNLLLCGTVQTQGKIICLEGDLSIYLRTPG